MRSVIWPFSWLYHDSEVERLKRRAEQKQQTDSLGWKKDRKSLRTLSLKKQDKEAMTTSDGENFNHWILIFLPLVEEKRRDGNFFLLIFCAQCQRFFLLQNISKFAKQVFWYFFLSWFNLFLTSIFSSFVSIIYLIR